MGQFYENLKERAIASGIPSDVNKWVYLFYTEEEYNALYNGSGYHEPWVSYTEELSGLSYSKTELTGISIEGLTWVTDIAASGGTASKDNCTYKVIASYTKGERIDVTASATVEGSLVVSSSMVEQRHTAGTLTLSASYEAFSATNSVDVYQEAFIPTLTAVTLDNLTWSRNVPASGGTATKDNCTYDVTAHYDNGVTSSVTSYATVTGSLVVSSSFIETAHTAGTLTLTATYEGLSDSDSVTVYQDAFVPTLTAVTIDNLTWNTNIAASGGTADKDNCTYTVTAHYDNNVTCAVTSTATVTGSLVVPSSFIETTHTAGTLTLTATYDGLSGSNTITVYQDAFVPTLTAVTLDNLAWSTNIPCTGGTANKDNCTYGVTAYYDNNVTCAVTNTATITGSLNVPLSKIESAHTAGTLTLTATYEGLSDSDSVTVYQDAFSYSMVPLTLNVMSAGTIVWKAQNSAYTTTIEYSTDSGETWTSITSNTGASAPSISVNAGDVVQFRGDNATYATNDLWHNTFSGSTAKFEVEGNIMSLIDSTGFTTATALESAYTFCYLFSNCVGLTSVENLILPATVLSYRCYYCMFQGCTSLTTAPALPATSLADICYHSMFRGCTSLTTAPSLPATSLTQSCYYYMFQGCTSLTSAPELPATTLAQGCYSSMFEGCTSLTSAPELPATTLAVACYSSMFLNCTNLTTAPELPATALTLDCYEFMFLNCTNLTTAPELPATTLANKCYVSMFGNCTGLTTAPSFIGTSATTMGASACTSMFAGCTSLTTAPELPATTLAQNCYRGMFQGCTSLTTAPVLPATTLEYGCYWEMFYQCTSLTTPPELPATSLADICYHSMFRGCTSLTVAPELPATTLARNCYISMFDGCTSLTTSPELPATTLAEQCYSAMFRGCTSLTTAPELPATTLANMCYYWMFYGCTNLTTAPQLPATVLTTSCYNGMFEGCRNLNYIKCLATDISATNCTSNWVYGVASTGTFVKHPDMSGWTRGVSAIPQNWNLEDDRDTLTKMPLTFEITSGGVVSWLFINNSGNGSAKTLEYKVNDGPWTEITSTTGGTTFNVSSGDTVQFRGDNTTLSYSSTTMQYRNEFSGTTAKFNVKGNVMSLLDKNNFENKTTFDPDSQFVFFLLFNYCTGLTSAKDLILPVTALTENCYRAMFQRCANLTEAPELPATILADYCYYNMFRQCTSLTTAPSILPATTLADYCYAAIFYGCTSLRTTPELHATTLASNCYNCMFRDCTSLTTAPELPATTLADYCYEYMFYNCTSLTTAPELPATTLAEGCYKFMFYNCTSLTTAPELPATTLTNNCYENMFDGCTSLTTAPELPATTLASDCYNYMFNSCSSLNYIKCLATDISANNCTYNWVNNVSSTGTFVKPSTTDWSSKTGSDGIPANWTVQDAS